MLINVLTSEVFNENNFNDLISSYKELTEDIINQAYNNLTKNNISNKNEETKYKNI